MDGDNERIGMRKHYLVRLTYNDKPSLSHDPGSSHEMLAKLVELTSEGFAALLADGSWVLVDLGSIATVNIQVI